MAFCIEVTPTSSEAIQLLLFKSGYCWEGSGKYRYVKHLQYGFLTIHTTYETFDCSNTGFHGYPIIKFQELCDLLDKPTMKIGEYDVEFTDNGVKVGCQFVSRDEINAIHDHFKE